MFFLLKIPGSTGHFSPNLFVSQFVFAARQTCASCGPGVSGSQMSCRVSETCEGVPHGRAAGRAAAGSGATSEMVPVPRADAMRYGLKMVQKTVGFNIKNKN